jgi:3-hydroxy-3-methylglutaryl CoA synthase
MNNLNKFYNDIVTPGMGVTGIGGDPLHNVIEISYILLCNKKSEASSEELVNSVTRMIDNFRKNMDNVYFRGGRSIPDYIKKLDEIEEALHDFCTAVNCPFEDLPLFVNSSPAAKIALRRLKDGR